MNDTMVTLVGNAATAVEHRQTAAGVTVARFRMAATSRRWDRAQERWTDGETSFYTVRSWRGLADNVAASVAVGEPLIVQGRLRLRRGAAAREGRAALVLGGGRRRGDRPRSHAGHRRIPKGPAGGAYGSGRPFRPISATLHSTGPLSGARPLSAAGTFDSTGTLPARAVGPGTAIAPGAAFLPASDSPSPPPPRPSPSPLSASVSPSPSSLSPQRSRPPHPAPPAQQDLWEGPLPEAGTRTTPKAPTAADSPTATSSPTNSPTNSPTDADPPTDAKARTAGEARPASRPRTGARGRRVLKEQRAAKGSTAAKTPATSGIAAGAGGSGDSAVSPSSVPHAPGKVTVP